MHKSHNKLTDFLGQMAALFLKDQCYWIPTLQLLTLVKMNLKGLVYL